ncbi:MAG: hypothetical protein NSGCLCUN01_01297 [uncultured Clostridium sp.]
MNNIKFNLLGKNKGFDIYINEKKLENFSELNYKYDDDNKEVKIKLVQNHICDNKNWLFRGMVEFILGLLSGIGGYSDFEENRGPYRAYCEGFIKANGNEIINIELKKKRVKRIPLKFTYKFYVNLQNGTSEWNEIKNVFESPNYLKRRWNIIRIPYILLSITALIVLILAFI